MEPLEVEYLQDAPLCRLWRSVLLGLSSVQPKETELDLDFGGCSGSVQSGLPNTFPTEHLAVLRCHLGERSIAMGLSDAHTRIREAKRAGV
jgi:hypothetical protein